MDKKQRICVIGGAGYIGSRLVPFLIDEGYEVVVVDMCWFGNHLDPSVTLVQADVLTLDESFFEDFDSVLFLGGVASDPMAEFAPAYNFTHNLAAPAYAAFAARKAGVKRFISAGSCSVYGALGGKRCLETDVTNPSYPYGVSKIQATRALQELITDDFSVIILRKGTLSGWSPRMRFDLLVNTLYKCAWTEGKITVHNPKIWRPLLAMEDCITAYKKALESPEKISGVFNISSLNIRVGEVADIVQDHFKEVFDRNIEVVKNNVNDVRDYTADTAQAESVLGMAFSGTVESILEGLDEHYGEKFSEYLDERYYNVPIFKKIFPTLQTVTLTKK